jgi:hypothetical protein
MPAEGRRQNLVRWRRGLAGQKTCAVVVARALGLLSLVKRYGKPRLEAACLVALELGSAKYCHVRDILVSGREQLPHLIAFSPGKRQGDVRVGSDVPSVLGCEGSF